MMASFPSYSSSRQYSRGECVMRDRKIGVYSYQPAKSVALTSSTYNLIRRRRYFLCGNSLIAYTHMENFYLNKRKRKIHFYSPVSFLIMDLGSWTTTTTLSLMWRGSEFRQPWINRWQPRLGVIVVSKGAGFYFWRSTTTKQRHPFSQPTETIFSALFMENLPIKIVEFLIIARWAEKGKDLPLHYAFICVHLLTRSVQISTTQSC